VTSRIINQLIHFNAAGDELRRVQLPDDAAPWHAVESPTGTFIVSNRNRQLQQNQIIEVNTAGKVLRQFSRSHLPSDSASVAPHVGVDSHGNVFAADSHRILLLDAHLGLRRVIVDEHQFNYRQPRRLSYIEQSGQLFVVLYSRVVDFDVLCLKQSATGGHISAITGHLSQASEDSSVHRVIFEHTTIVTD